MRRITCTLRVDKKTILPLMAIISTLVFVLLEIFVPTSKLNKYRDVIAESKRIKEEEKSQKYLQNSSDKGVIVYDEREYEISDNPEELFDMNPVKVEVIEAEHYFDSDDLLTKSTYSVFNNSNEYSKALDGYGNDFSTSFITGGRDSEVVLKVDSENYKILKGTVYIPKFGMEKLSGNSYTPVCWTGSSYLVIEADNGQILYQHPRSVDYHDDAYNEPVNIEIEIPEGCKRITVRFPFEFDCCGLANLRECMED